MTRFLELWSKVTGVDAHFEQITPEEFGRPLGPPLDVQMIDVTSYLQEFGFFGKDNRFVGPEEVSSPSLLVCAASELCVRQLTHEFVHRLELSCRARRVSRRGSRIRIGRAFLDRKVLPP